MTIVDTGKTLFFRNRFCILFVLLLCVILIPSYFEDSVWIGKFWRGLFLIFGLEIAEYCDDLWYV